MNTIVTFYCFNVSFGCCEFRLLLYIAYIVVNGLRCHMTTLNFGVIKNNVLIMTCMSNTTLNTIGPRTKEPAVSIVFVKCIIKLLRDKWDTLMFIKQTDRSEK